MPLSSRFNDSYKATKENDNVLTIKYTINGNTTLVAFDFMARIMLARTGSGDGGVNVTPFSQLDRGTLIEMRDKLIELQGNPPELPPEEIPAQSPSRKFNL